MDPVRNPYAPGAGQRPPELAGRDAELAAFDVLLERVARGRPERSVVLTGLRGVGKTVLLNALRSAAVRRGWGTGKLEARPDQPIRRPLAAALHLAVRELAGGNADEAPTCSAWSSPSPSATRRPRAGSGSPASTSPRCPDGPTPATSRSICVELFTDVAGLAGDTGHGIAIFLDEMQDLGPDDVSALCAACHELSQQGLPLVVVGAGLPHLPTVLSASKSYSERLFRYARIDRLDRAAHDLALRVPARDEHAEFTDDALAAMYEATGGYPYFVQAYGKVAWDVAPRSPITAADIAVAAPEAEAELAVGFFGSRYERATPAEREYLRAMADVGGAGDAVLDRRRGEVARAAAAVAFAGARRPAEEGPGLLRPARPHRVHRPALRPVPAPPHLIVAVASIRPSRTAVALRCSASSLRAGGSMRASRCRPPPRR